MGDSIRGKYFSFTAGSVTAGQDLIARAETLTGEEKIWARKLTLISSGSIRLAINEQDWYSTLYQDADFLYKLSLDDDDCRIDSLIVGDTSACPIFVAMVF